MVKHIVMFALKDDLDAAKRQEVMEAFRQGIEALASVIPFIREIRVDFNINPAETTHICLTSLFDSLDDVKAYAVHPSHVAVAGALKPYVKHRACVDYAC